MSNQTVATTGGRVSITSLPSLTSPQPSDTVLGVQNGRAGLFPLSALTVSSDDQTPNLSAYAKSSDLTTETEERKTADADLEKQIQGLNIPSVEGLAKSGDLAAESQARQTADADLQKQISGRLPLSGGTINGPLTLNNGFSSNGFGAFSSAAGIEIGDSTSRGMIGARTDGTDGNGQLTSLYIGVLSTQEGWKEWNLKTSGTFYTPSGRTLIEATGSSGRPITVQRFTAQAGNGTYISFPQSFSSDSVQVMIPSYFDGKNFIISGTQTPPDRNGFTMSKISIGSAGMAWENTASTVDIIAISEI